MLFYHVMSQLTIVLTNNSDAPVTGVTVGGLVPTAVVDFTVPSAAAKSGAAAADVEAFEVTADAAYRAILVPVSYTHLHGRHVDARDDRPAGEKITSSGDFPGVRSKPYPFFRILDAE